MTNLVRPYRPAKPARVAQGFEDLPLDLLRTSLVTRQPQATAAAAMQYQAVMRGQAQPPMMLPQSLQFGHWNRQQGPSGVVRGDLPPALASARGAIAAMRQSGTARMPRVVGPAPIMRMREAAASRGGQQVPQPGTHVNMQPPISRRFPDPPPQSGPPPAAYAESAALIQGIRQRERVSARSVATGEAMAAANATRLLIYGRR